MRKISLSILLILLSVFVLSCKNKKRIHESDLYLGQKPPGTSPEVFSPGIISANEKNHSCVAISSDGREAYWSLFSTISGVRQERIWTSILEEGVWTKTRLVPFSSDYREGGPRFSPDGRRLYFTSCRPFDNTDESGDANIWFVERERGGWGPPEALEFPVNTEYQEWNPSIAANGNIYYMYRIDSEPWDIYCAEFNDGKYSVPYRLSNAVNSPFVDGFCFISPDESYLYFYSERPGGCTEYGELYISYRTDDGEWSEALNMGSDINFSMTRFPGLSPDGRYFFFSSVKENLEPIYWVDAKIIKDLGRN